MVKAAGRKLNKHPHRNAYKPKSYGIAMETAKAAEKPTVNHIGYVYELAGFSRLNIQLGYADSNIHVIQKIKTDFESLEKLLDSAFSGCEKKPIMEICSQVETELSAGYDYVLFRNNIFVGMPIATLCRASYAVSVAEFRTAATIKFYFMFTPDQKENIFTVYDKLLATYHTSDRAKAVADQIAYLRQSGQQVTPKNLLSSNAMPLLIASKAKR